MSCDLAARSNIHEGLDKRLPRAGKDKSAWRVEWGKEDGGLEAIEGELL